MYTTYIRAKVWCDINNDGAFICSRKKADTVVNDF